MLKQVWTVLAAASIGGIWLAQVPARADDDGAYSLSAAGNAENGKRIFNQCRACHNLSNDAPAKIGPNLHGIFGRRAGSAEDFTQYSKALQDADFEWTEAQLDQWLTNPRGFLPGNKMSFPGLRRDQDRKDLLAFLRQASADDHD